MGKDKLKNAILPVLLTGMFGTYDKAVGDVLEYKNPHSGLQDLTTYRFNSGTRKAQLSKKQKKGRNAAKASKKARRNNRK